MELKSILTELKKQFQKLLGKKFSSLILYGSYARGDETEESDIDLLLLLNEELTQEEKILVDEILSQFSLKNDVVLSCIDYPLELYNNYNTPFLLNVKSEGMRIWKIAKK